MAESSSGGGEESGSEGTGGCATSMCGAHEDQYVDFVVDGEKGHAEDLFDVPCTITDDGRFCPGLQLDCVENGIPVLHEIDIVLSDYVQINLDEGREVLFSWVVIAPFWTEDYITLRSTEGELLFAGGRDRVHRHPEHLARVDPRENHCLVTS